MNNYEINEDTLAIISKSNKISIVYEKYNNYIVYQNIIDILNNSCKYYGSSFEGRKIASCSLLKVNYKVPIIVEESSNMIFFPTSSLRNNNCSWISLNNIDRYERNYRGSKIYFKSGKSIIFPISYGILNNQILRSSRLIYLLKERKLNKITKNDEKY